MISLFRKKTEDKPFKPLLSGKLEASLDTLKSRHGDSLSGRVYDIDISDYTSEYVGIIRVPKKVQQGVRDVLDDYLKEGEDFYFQVDEKIFGVFFTKAPKVVAELKIQVIHNELSRVIETLKDKKKTAPPAEEQFAQLPQKLALRDKGTLSNAPDEMEMRDWASRALASMSTRTGWLDFHADIERMAELVKTRYYPLWYTKNRILSGYALQTGGTLTRKTYDEQRGHEDLAVLGAAARQLMEMQERSEYALLVVPVHIHTICDMRTRDLYNVYCRMLGPGLQRFIVLQLIGLGDRRPTLTDWEAVRSLRHHCRSIIIDTGAGKIPPEDPPGLKFMIYGFDLRLLPQPEDQLFMHIENLAIYYQNRQKEVFLMGVDSRSLLAAGLGAGYSYIAGEAIAPATHQPKAASYLQYEDVYQDILQ